jgi:hypothetical protein
MAVGRGGVPWLFGQDCRPHRPTRASQAARDLTGSRMHLATKEQLAHNLAVDGAARPATTRVSTALGSRSMVRMGPPRRPAVVERQCPVQRRQGVPASPCGGSWPVTCRDPALGTKTDSEPESQRTVMSRSSTAVTTPLRVTVPTFSDSTSTRSPTSTILGLLWMMTEPGTQVSATSPGSFKTRRGGNRSGNPVVVTQPAGILRQRRVQARNAPSLAMLCQT